MPQLVPGAVILLHDGPNDTPAGAGSVEALGLIIDAARERGFCFGVTDHTGEVVASRYVASGRRIPQIVNPVPYNRLVRPGTPPPPYVFAESPITIAATHSPATFAAGSVGNTLTLTVTNVSGAPTDDSTVTVTDRIPAGLTATAAGGNGWTCSARRRSAARAPTCWRRARPTRRSRSPSTSRPTRSRPPTRPCVVGHGGVWQAPASDPIEVRPPG